MNLSHVLKFHFGAKDGGPESRVWLYGIESKLFGSLLLLKFGEGSREAFHTHAFNAVSWVLTGCLAESICPTFGGRRFYWPSWRPVVTKRETYHKVQGCGDPNSWVLTVRGPWRATWREFLPRLNRSIVLTHGRKEVASG